MGIVKNVLSHRAWFNQGAARTTSFKKQQHTHKSILSAILAWLGLNSGVTNRFSFYRVSLSLPAFLRMREREAGNKSDEDPLSSYKKPGVR